MVAKVSIGGKYLSLFSLLLGARTQQLQCLAAMKNVTK